MALFTALAAIGGSVLTAVGATTAFVSSTIGATIAGAIGGALVGAAIGGLTSAIMGGDIMQGVLFGAIGGAVTGGISGYLGAGTNMVGDLATTGVKAAGEAGGMVYDSVSGEVFTSVAARETLGGSLQTIGGELVKEYGGDVVKGLAGAYMEGKKMDMEQQNWLEQAAIKQQYDLQTLEKQAQLASEARASSSGGGGGSEVPYLEMERIRQETAREQTAEQRRQYDISHEERMLARSDLQTKEGERRALFQGYGGRGAPSEGAEGGKGVYQLRQEEGLANVEGGQPITGSEPMEKKPEEALA